MGNTLRCCISCILPCGALDVVRVVHSNGRVEEISGSVTAGEIMKAHPKHILKKPTSRCSDAAVSSSSSSSSAPRIVVVPPDALLQRGKIYFLIPVAGKSRSVKPGNYKKRRKEQSVSPTTTTTTITTTTTTASKTASASASALRVDSDRYLSELLTEKVSTQRDRRRGRVAVWRPHLESITESNSAGENSGDL